MEEFMKKKIIILVSIIAFLLLIGGGIAAYYFSYLPMKKEAEEKLLDHEISKYVDNYCKLLEQQKFNEANIFLKNFRIFLKERESHTSLLAFYYSYSMENALWYMQKDYEKMKVIFPEMERLLKKIEKSKLSEDKILTAKWSYISDLKKFYYKNNEHKKAFVVIENFITTNGGERKLEEQELPILYAIYADKADCLLKLGEFEKCKKYIEKVISFTRQGNDLRQYHIALLHMAELYLNQEKPDVTLKYTQKAHEIYQSRRSYCYFAMAYYQQKKMEEAKKYYALAISCKKLPSVSDHSMKEFGKLLSE